MKIAELSNANYTIQLLKNEKEDLIRKLEAITQALGKF